MVGKKGRDFFRRRQSTIRQEFAGRLGRDRGQPGQGAGPHGGADLREGKVDAVYLVYNEFKSAIVQRVVAEQLLPVPPPAAAHGGPRRRGADRLPVRAEPGRSCCPR